MGLYFVGTALILLVISVFYNHSLAYAATFLFLGFFCLSAFITKSNIKGLALHRKNHKRQYAYEEEQSWGVVFQNVSEKPIYMIELKGQAKELTCLESLRFERLGFSTSFRRGLHTMATLGASSIFPFGLFRASVVMAADMAFLVAPRRENKTPLSLSDFACLGPQGKWNPSGGGDEFEDYREYAEGEPIGCIDWKKSCLDTLWVKTYSTRESQVYLIDENRVKNRVSSREALLTTMSYFIDLCNKCGSDYAIKWKGQTGPFGRGQKHWENIMERIILEKEAI